MNWDSKSMEIARSLRNNGKTMVDIGLVLGVSRGAVAGIISRHKEFFGIHVQPARPKKPKKPKKPRFERVINLSQRPKPKDVKVQIQPSPPAVEQSVTGKSLLELGNHDCRWGVGEEPVTGRHLFCAASVVDGKPYCGPHLRIAYREMRKS
jgi:hypothetical protein